MKVIRGNRSKRLPSGATDKEEVVLDLTLKNIPVFKGFTYTVAEGLAIAQRHLAQRLNLKSKSDTTPDG